MNLNMNFLKNENTKIILGILWGFGLACIFNSACNGRNCIIYKAPNKKDIKDNIYEFNDKCYIYNTVDSECNDNVINA
jgi:hypothetical protein